MSSDPRAPAVRTLDLGFAYGGQPVLEAVMLDVAAGESIAIIGPNGAGKTTLLACISGLIRPAIGRVWLAGRDVAQLRPRDIAAIVATVPQEFQIPFAYRVREIVSLGRSPYLGRFGTLSEADERTVDWALHVTETLELQGRTFNDLSGGERQRVVVALALAQEPELLLLDEPTAHLDLAHQLDVLQLVRQTTQDRGTTVIAAMHDIDLAAAFFARTIVLHRGRIVADGPPAEVITPAMLADVFRVQAEVVIDAATGSPRVVPRLLAGARR